MRHSTEFLARWAYWNPARATWVAYPAADHAKLPDVTPQALRAWEAEQDEFLRRTRVAAGNPGMSDLDRVSAAILLEWLEGSAAVRACRFELWALGWQSTYSQLAQLQPVDDAGHRAAALARLRRLPALVDQEIANLREGIRLGHLASQGSVARALAEIDALIALPAAEWPFLDPAKRAADPSLAAEMEREVAERLAPATRRYRDFLRSEYPPRSRTVPGVLANPEGAACYRAAVRAYVTLDLPPERIHEIGLKELARVEAEMKSLSERALGTSDLSVARRMLQSDERHTFATREDVLEAIDRTITSAWFGRIPAARVMARPWPAFQEVLTSGLVPARGKGRGGRGHLPRQCVRAPEEEPRDDAGDRATRVPVFGSQNWTPLLMTALAEGCWRSPRSAGPARGAARKARAQPRRPAPEPMARLPPPSAAAARAGAYTGTRKVAPRSTPAAVDVTSSSQ